MPGIGVSSPAGVHRPSSAQIPRPHTGVLPLDDRPTVDFEQLFLRLSPRLSIRVDTRDRRGRWRHKYVSRPLPTLPPAGPYAIHLADTAGRFRWICFDLDAKRGQVGPDLATLLRWLEEAGLTYVVAASGAADGRHVWVTAEQPLDAAVVASIAQAAARRLPTLDHGMLCNPRQGGVRPIGAPHRQGGRSTLLAPCEPRRAAGLLTPATCGNVPDAFARLLLIINAVPAPAAPRPRLVDDTTVQVITDELGPRLPGTPSTVLDDDTIRLLTRRPPEERASETLASLLTKLALRRWTWPMVKRLLKEKRHREGGLLHACTRPGSGSLREVLDDEETLAKLRRQWARCVEYAATLPLTRESQEWTDRIGDIVALVDQLQQAADACPRRWATDSGPADRAALDLCCLLALRAGTTVLSLDVRRAALATGHGRSTMHRALARLSLDGWLAKRDADGAAGTYELLPITTGHPAFSPHAKGGTQGTPPPSGEARTLLIERLQARLAAGQADLFAYGRPGLGFSAGLGHHAARVYQQLLESPGRPLTTVELCQRTGYGPRTIARHMKKLQDLLVARRAVMAVHHECPTCQALPGERCTVYGRPVHRRRADQQHSTRQSLAVERAGTAHYRARRGSLTAAAKALGVHGRGAARARLYAVEIEQYHWWQQEEAWMRTPKNGLRTGPRVSDDQAALVLTTLPTQPRRRYPRAADGRADHQAARTRILNRVATA